MANLEKVRAVVDHIEQMTRKDPTKFFYMPAWHTNFSGDTIAELDEIGHIDASNLLNTEDEDLKQQLTENNICGTGMCFAGWAVHYANQNNNQESFPSRNGFGSWDFRWSDAGAEVMELNQRERCIFGAIWVRTIPQLKAEINHQWGLEVFPADECDYSRGIGG